MSNSTRTGVLESLTTALAVAFDLFQADRQHPVWSSSLGTVRLTAIEDRVTISAVRIKPSGNVMAWSLTFRAFAGIRKLGPSIRDGVVPYTGARSFATGDFPLESDLGRLTVADSMSGNLIVPALVDGDHNDGLGVFRASLVHEIERIYKREYRPEMDAGVLEILNVLWSSAPIS